ncbi:MAG: GGDEF domain-containing protein [Pseudomonadota bacterium]
MERSFKFVVSVVFGSVLVSVLFTVAILAFLKADGSSWVIGLSISSIVPVFVSLPVCLYVVRQRKVLDNLNAELHRAYLKLKETNEQIVVAASLDDLTGALNRKHFFERLQARRASDESAFLILDIDHFKQVNDTFGHQAGDRAIVLVARTIGGMVRKTDLVGRIGGEEFAVFLPATPMVEAIRVAESMRSAISELSFLPRNGHSHGLTISVGVSRVHQNSDVSTIYDRADTALYEAKRSGRNLVMVADLPEWTDLEQSAETNADERLDEAAVA